ncbi:uncharacterized protein METZ01_LOCUS173101, partial [marine metagenome]
VTFHYQFNIISILLGVILIQLLSGFSNVNDDNMENNSKDSLFSNLITIEEKNLEIRK